MLGRAAHKLILEGAAAFADAYATGGPINEQTGKPYGPTTKAFKEWADAANKQVLSDPHHKTCLQMVESVESNQFAYDLLFHGEAECVVRVLWREMPCQARIDWIHDTGTIVDLKTCDDLTWFEHDARRYGYFHQLAFYRAVWEVASNCIRSPEMFLIVVEKKEPYRSGVWKIDRSSLAVADQENVEAMERLKVCKTAGKFPSGYEDVRTLALWSEGETNGNLANLTQQETK